MKQESILKIIREEVSKTLNENENDLLDQDLYDITKGQKVSYDINDDLIMLWNDYMDDEQAKQKAAQIGTLLGKRYGLQVIGWKVLPETGDPVFIIKR